MVSQAPPPSVTSAFIAAPNANPDLPALVTELLILTMSNLDTFVKSKNLPFYVIPAKAGIQSFQLVLDSRFHGSDDFETFYESINNNNFDFAINMPSFFYG